MEDVRAQVICNKCGRRRATEEDEGVHNTGECGCDDARSLCWRDYCGECGSTFDPDYVSIYTCCMTDCYRCRHCGRSVEKWGIHHDEDGQFSCQAACGATVGESGSEESSNSGSLDCGASCSSTQAT